MREVYGLQSLCDNREETADLSTTLRSGRDDKFVIGQSTVSPGDASREWLHKFVISTGAQRSGEICGFFSVITQTRNFKGGSIP